MGKIKLTAQLEEIILNRLAEGEALNAICSDENIDVAESTVRKRAVDDDDFGARYARAREVGYDCRAERAVENAKAKDAAENPQAARLAFDAERWYLGKMKPQTYGDKIDVTSGGEKISAEVDEVTRATRLAAIFKDIEKRNAAD